MEKGRLSLVNFAERTLGSALPTSLVDNYEHKFLDVAKESEFETEVPTNWFRQLFNGESIFKRGQMMRVTIMCTVMQTLICIGFYSFLYMSTGDNSSFYVDNAMNAAVDILFCALATVFGDRLGRRNILCGTSIFNFIVVFTSIMLSHFEMSFISRWLNFVCKGTYAVMFMIIMTYRNEIFPSTVRTQGGAFIEAISRTAALLDFGYQIVYLYPH